MSIQVLDKLLSVACQPDIRLTVLLVLHPPPLELELLLIVFRSIVSSIGESQEHSLVLLIRSHLELLLLL